MKCKLCDKEFEPDSWRKVFHNNACRFLWNRLSKIKEPFRLNEQERKYWEKIKMVKQSGD